MGIPLNVQNSRTGENPAFGRTPYYKEGGITLKGPAGRLSFKDLTRFSVFVLNFERVCVW